MMEIVKNAYIPESATSPRQLNRAKRHILVGESGEFAASFSKLPAFCTMFEKLNPGSQASVEVDLENNFESMFFGFRSCVDVMKSVGLPVFAIDGCHTSHPLFKGWKLLLLVGRLANNTILTISGQLCSTESADTFRLFARKNRELGLDDLFKNADTSFVRDDDKVYSAFDRAAELGKIFGGEIPAVFSDQ